MDNKTNVCLTHRWILRLSHVLKDALEKLHVHYISSLQWWIWLLLTFLKTNTVCSRAAVKRLSNKSTKSQLAKTAIMHYRHNRGAAAQCKRFPWPVSLRSVHWGTLHGAASTAVLCSVWSLVCCRAAQWPQRLLAVSPLSSLITLRLSLCACILGNLPPTMKRALASAWEAAVPWQEELSNR